MSVFSEDSDLKTVTKQCSEGTAQVRGVLRAAPGIQVRTFDADDVTHRRMVTRIRCPMQCTPKLKEWLCEKCSTQVTFNVSGSCFCVCGVYNIMGAEYRCNEPAHILMKRASSFVLQEDYNVAVISSNRDQSAAFLKAIRPDKEQGSQSGLDGVTILNQNQQLFRFVDVMDEKSFHNLSVYHAVCIIPGSYPCSIRHEKELAIEMFGEDVLQNIVVCVPEKENGKCGSPSTTFIDTDMTFNAIFYSDLPAEEQVASLLKFISGMVPVGRFVIEELQAEEAVFLGRDLLVLSRMLTELVGNNLKLLTKCEPGSTVRKTFMLTSSAVDPCMTPTVLDMKSVIVQFLPSCDNWFVEVFIADFKEPMDQKVDPSIVDLLTEEMDEFQKVSEELKTILAQNPLDVDAILDIREQLIGSRYSEEVYEFLTVSEWKWADSLKP